MKTLTARQRFKIQSFTNRSGTISHRVTGSRRNGQRVRENFTDAQDAHLRQVALETEYLQRETSVALRSTRLTEPQVLIAEKAFANLPDDNDLLRAVAYWLKHGKQTDVANSPTVDEALARFKGWLNGEKDSTGNGVCKLRDLTRLNLRVRVEAFCNAQGLRKVSEVTPEDVELFIGRMQNVTASTKIAWKLCISRFFSWCAARPRRWVTSNPCALVKIEMDEKSPPKILSLDQCEKILRASEAAGFASYIALCLLGGLRPYETRRLSWEQINLKDREIRLEAAQTKTGRGRVVSICDTLASWWKPTKGNCSCRPTLTASSAP